MKITLPFAAALLLSLSMSAQAAPKPSCDQIDAAISSTEDFAETILAGDAKAAEEALGAIRETFSAVRQSLPADAVAAIDAKIAATETAAQAGDASGAAVAAMEAYRLLAAAFEARLPTTLDVAMLDYSGFRLHGLAAAPAADWAAISTTVAEAGGNWATARKRMDDKTLVDLGTSVQAGLESAVSAKQAGWLSSLAQIQLDSVDLLERAVKNKAKGACK